MPAAAGAPFVALGHEGARDALGCRRTHDDLGRGGVHLTLGRLHRRPDRTHLLGQRRCLLVGKREQPNGSHQGQFSIDINSMAVNDACIDMLKGGQRQMTYRLTKQYFNGVPANQVRSTSPVKCMTDDQWKELEMWSTTKHKKQEKYKDTEPTAIDLFKDTHCCKKNGFSEPVKKAIADMEAIMAEPVEDGQKSKSSTDVSQVLPQSSAFLQNVGLQSASRRSSRGAVSSQVQELQAQLETEKHDAVELRQELHTIKSHAQESEATMARQSHEI